MKNIFVFPPVGIVAIGTEHPFDPFMHFIAQDTPCLMAIETECFPGILQQMFIFGTVWIVTGGAISSCNRTMQVIVLFGQIFMTEIAEPRLGLQHATQRALIMTGGTFPLSIGIVHNSCRYMASHLPGFNTP